MRLIDADAIKIKPPKGSSLEFDAGALYAIDEICKMPTIGLSEQAKRDIATIIENEMDMRVVADRKHGKWEWIGNPKFLVCSECRAHIKYGLYKVFIGKDERGLNYCPNCGARMVMSDE